jgi:CRISPR-associated protein Csa1
LFFLSTLEVNKWIVNLRQGLNANGISDDLRGWSWDRPPVQPPLRSALLGVGELSARYCSTYRDIYLKKVANIPVVPTRQMLEGLAIHLVSQKVISLVKKYIYQKGIVEGFQLIHEMSSACSELCLEIIHEVKNSSKEVVFNEEELQAKIEHFYKFLVVQAGAKLDQAASRFPHSDVDSIVSSMMLPVAEKKIDGSLIGLSKELSVDMCTDGPMLIDIKTGEPKEFHKYSLAGYALAIECESGFEVNFGLIVYIRFVNEKYTPNIYFSPFVIGDELRREFLEMRDEALTVLNLGKDPGLPEQCPLSCAYYGNCHPSSETGTKVQLLEANSE